MQGEGVPRDWSGEQGEEEGGWVGGWGTGKEGMGWGLGIGGQVMLWV